jgi:VWFA-related protein
VTCRKALDVRTDRRPLRAALLACACALLVLAAAPAGGQKNRDGRYGKETTKALEALPEPYRAWLLEVELIIDEEELAAFLALEKDYQRDAFIERFWRIRDPYPETARNEFKDNYQDRLAEARSRYGNLEEDRAVVLLLNGFPDGHTAIRCTGIAPLEVWYYAGSDQIRREFLLIFYQRGGLGRLRLWRGQFEGVDVLMDNLGAASSGRPLSLRDIAINCVDGEMLVAAIAFALNDPIGFQQLVDRIERDSRDESGEWIATFNTYSTDVPEGAAPLPAVLELGFPGRRQSRTVVQAALAVPREEAAVATLADYRSYNFVVTGEVLLGKELFDNFRYKFDFPASEVEGEQIPLVFERPLRPGDYTLVLKLEDVNGARFFRAERPLTVPKVDNAMPPPPADPVSAQLLAEANAAIAAGETTLQIVEPRGELVTGYVRFDTLTTGDGIARVDFALDGKILLSKRRPPYSVDLDLGRLPRTHVLTAVAYDPEGAEVAGDEVLINASRHRFALRLVEPRKGRQYSQSLRAVAAVETPDGVAPERVEFYLNETRVATLYQEPWEQPIMLPGGEPIAYVRAVAFLPDGNSTEDLVFVNAPEYLEEIDVQFVELYTTVLDREGRPVEGLGREIFRVFEDGVEQEILRFERVDDLSIHAAILLDISASMEESLGDARDAALSFYQGTIAPRDRAALVTFNDRPNLQIQFTNDLTELAGGLAGLKAERGTALYDSVVFALYYFNGIKGQRALLVLSDGKDEASRFGFEETLEFSRRAGVTVYAIALRDDAAHKKLSKLAEATGGRSFLIQSAAELAPVYRQIEEELRSQYLIAYQSSNTTEATDFRRVELKVDRPGLEVKTLQGYYP